MSATVAELLATLGREACDPAAAAAAGGQPVTGAAPIHDAGAGDVTFCTARLAGAEELIAGLTVRVLVVDEQLAARAHAVAGGRIPAIVPSPSPRLDFARLLTAHFTPPRPVGVSPHAVVAEGARLGADVYVGPLATIGEQVVVGDRTAIHAGVHVVGRVTIGAGVTIHSGTVIGSAGYGYERNEQGGLEAFPQIGSVEIEDDVEIGANACIDRGALGPTRIGRGARIDNLVHIAHNVQIGRDAAVIANAMVAGSTRVGERAWIAPSATVRDQITVGDDALVGLGAVVVRPVPDGVTVLGNPARER